MPGGKGGLKQHLTDLYGKFGVPDGERRRSRLANAALDAAAVWSSSIRRSTASPSSAS